MADPKNRYITFLDKEALKAGEEKLIRINEADYNNEYGTFEEYAKAQNATIYNADGVEWDPTYDTEPEAVQQLDEVVVEAPKGKFATEKEQQAKNIQDNISKITPETSKHVIAKEYFNLDDNYNPILKRPKIQKQYITGRGYYEDFVNTQEKDTELTLGEKKYNEWVNIRNKANKDGVKLTAENIGNYFDLNDIDEETKQFAINKEKDYQSQQYLKELTESERTNVIPYLFPEGKFRDEALQTMQKSFELQTKKDKWYGNEDQWQEWLKKNNYTNEDVFPTYKTIKDKFNKEYKDKEKQYIEDQKIWKVKENEVISFNEKKSNEYKKLEERAKGYKLTIQNDLFESEAEAENVRSQLEADINKWSTTYEGEAYDKLIDDYFKETASLKNKYEELDKAALATGDLNFALSALAKNYDKTARLAQVWEESILGSSAMVGASLLKGIGDVATIGVEDKNLPDWYQGLLDLKGAAINYNEKLQKRRETTLPQKAKYKDKDYWAEVFIENSPSITLALTTAGATGLGSYVGGAAGRKLAFNYSAKTTMGTFFTMETGQQLSNLEIGQKNAPKIITALENELKTETNLAKRDELLKQLDHQKNLMNATQFQKSFNAYSYGFIATLAERFGTLSVIKNFNKISRSVGRTRFEKFMKPSIARVASKNLGNVVGVGIGTKVEMAEEYFTKGGQNLFDIVALGENKSLLDGMDAEFFRNVGATSLAIYGPMTMPNVYNSISSELKLRSEAKRIANIKDDLFAIQDKLQTIDGRSKEARKLAIERDNLFKELELIETTSMLKAGQLTNDEIEVVFENNKRIRDFQREASEIGSGIELTEYDKRRFETLKAKAQKLFDINQEILDKKNKEYKAINPDVESILNKSRHDAMTHLVKNLDGINAFVLNENNIEEFLKSKEGEYTENQIQKIRKNYYTNRSSGTNLNNDVLIFDDNAKANIDVALQNGLSTEAGIASVSPMHEVGHIQTRKAGIIKDDKLVVNLKIYIMI